MREIKTSNFLELGNKSTSRTSAELNYYYETAAELTVAAVNSLKDELGFSLTMESGASGRENCRPVTFISSQAVNADFFLPLGVFWSTLRSIYTGIDMVGEISPQEAQVIFMAEMAKVNTADLILTEIQKPISPDSKVQWQAAMTKIQSQLPAAN